MVHSFAEQDMPGAAPVIAAQRALAFQPRHAIPDHLYTAPVVKAGRPIHLLLGDEAEHPLTPEHVAWRERQDDGSVLVGFDGGEVWHGKKVLNRATERRDAEEWTLHGHWTPDEPETEG